MASQLDVQQGLAEAVKALYRVFSSYPLAQRVEGCPCCVSASDENLLRNKPLQHLTAKELHRYAFKLRIQSDDDMGNDRGFQAFSAATL